MQKPTQKYLGQMQKQRRKPLARWNVLDTRRKAVRRYAMQRPICGT
jgi:hypothetical protein